MLIKRLTLTGIAVALICCKTTDMVGISRLTDEMVEQQKIAFSSLEEKNVSRRKIVKTGSCCVAAAATVGALYMWLKRDNAPCIQSGTLEEVSKKVDYLEKLSKGPSFASADWFKKTAVDFLFSNMVLANVLHYAGKVCYRFVHSIFYNPTLSWYLYQRTNLGMIKDAESEQEGIQRRIAMGTLLQEIMYHIAKLDGKDEKIAQDKALYHVNRITHNMDTVVHEVAGLVAFLQFKAAEWSSALDDRYKQAGLEASDRARYVFNLTNSLCDSLGSALQLYTDQANQKLPLLPIFRGYFNELEQALVSFARFEDQLYLLCEL